MDAYEEMEASIRGDEPHISPSELNAGLGFYNNERKHNGIRKQA